jgi:hypothetical protein
MQKISLSDFKILHDIASVYFKDTVFLKSAACNTFLQRFHCSRAWAFQDSFNSFSAGITATCGGMDWRGVVCCTVISSPLISECDFVKLPSMFHVSYKYKNTSIKHAGRDVKAIKME